MSWPWNELGLPGPANLSEIRRAYAQRLKTTHPEEDPEGFQRLHDAYQTASRMARRRRAAGQRPPEEPAEASQQAGPSKKEESAWDYNRLFEQGEASENPQAPAPEAAENWDYDRLLKQDTAEQAAAPKHREAAWDYERLFAEGEAEAQEARRRKIEELRAKNKARYDAQEREQRQRTADQEEAWAAVMAAAHALELLMSSNAPLSEWRRFLESSVFWNVRSNLDFVFALEDFLEQNPDLPQIVRQAIFAAYELEKGVKPEYTHLNRLLNVSRREKQALRRETSLWRRQWRSWPKRRQFATVFGMVFLGLLTIIAFWDLVAGAGTSVKKLFTPESTWEEQVLEWLEEDFGQPFAHSQGEDSRVYTPADRPDLCFWVVQDGERDDGQPGYRTNFPNILVMDEMKGFAQQWNLGLSFDSAGEGYQGLTGEAPGAYLFDLSLTGAEEAVSALGALLEDIQGQTWFQPRTGGEDVAFQVFLCHKGLAFYDTISTSGSGFFDTELALERYAQIGGAYCRYILEHSGLSDRHMGADTYVLLDRGTVEIDGADFFWVWGADKDTYAPLVQYFLSVSGTTLSCLPPEAPLTAMELCSGTSTHVQLEHIGVVLVWDRVAPE